MFDHNLQLLIIKKELRVLLYKQYSLFMVILIARTKKLGTVILNSLGGKNMIFHNFCRFFHGVHLTSNVFELYLECMLWCPPLN